MLCTALMSLLSVSAYAITNDTLNNEQFADATPTTNVAPEQQSAPITQTVPVPDPAAAPTAPPYQGSANQLINCQHHIPPEISVVDESVVTTWAKNAAQQSFDFDHAAFEKQLETLKACYTEQGWLGFNDALKKSGNIDAIKTQQLVVSSQVDGELKVSTIKENQWKVTVPLRVVYQNDKQKLTQQLSVNLLIGRKVSGDLGIMQMIATPRQVPGTESSGMGQQPTKTDEVPHS